MKAFWERWYFPANVTLYVVGDLERSTADTVNLIKKVFGKMPAASEPLPPSAEVLPLPSATVSAAAAAASVHSNGNGNGNGAAAQQLGPLKARHAVRPPVEHKWGYGPLAPGVEDGGDF